jgi:hypothetical protein
LGPSRRRGDASGGELRNQDPVVAVPMDAGRWNEPGQALEELEGSEAKHFAAVHIGLREPIHPASLRRGERLETGGGVEPLQGERPARTVPNKPLKTRSVLGLDPDRCVDGKPAGPLPCAHIRRHGGVQEATAGEPAQDAKLHRAGQGLRVLSLRLSGLEAGGLVEPDSPLDVAGDHAIEGQHVVVVVGIERTPKALGKGDGSELRVANRSQRARACVTQRGPECPEEDTQHPTRHLVRLVQEGSEPLGYGEHPLPHGEVRDHLVGQVGRHLRHAPCVAGGTDPPSFAGEGQKPVVSAVRAAHTCEAVSQDAAPQVASEVALHPGGDAPAHRVRILRLGEAGLQMVLDHRVQGRLGGAARAIDGTGWMIRRRCRGARPSTGGMGRGCSMRGHVPTHRKSVRCAMAASAILRCHPPVCPAYS